MRTPFLPVWNIPGSPFLQDLFGQRRTIQFFPCALFGHLHRSWAQGDMFVSDGSGIISEEYARFPEHQEPESDTNQDEYLLHGDDSHP